jgi:DNA-directed RNA polymerase subunit F
MQASFDRDCFLADNLIVIGYSFSDEHINECIRIALLYNSQLKIHIIDCGFENDLALKYLSEFTKLKSHQKPKNIKENIISLGNTFVYKYKFKDFLSNKIEFVNE